MEASTGPTNPSSGPQSPFGGTDLRGKGSGSAADRMAAFKKRARIEKESRLSRRCRCPLSHPTGVPFGYDMLREGCFPFGDDVAKPNRWLASPKEMMFIKLNAKWDLQYN